MIESCISHLGDDIMPNCADQRKLEFTGEGVIFDLDANSATVISWAESQRNITGISVLKTAGASPADGDVFIVDNLMRNPFDGTNHSLNTENGRPSYDYSLPIRVPNVSASVSEKVIEPLATGRFVGVFPTTNGKYIVYGAYGRWNANEINWNPSENGGDAVATMTSNEPYFMVETTKTVYDTLVEQAQNRAE